jgi:1-acyl-sn-glycerol-3-phosphate acyltransferase
VVAIPSTVSWLGRQLDRSHPRWGSDPSQFDPDSVETTLRWMAHLFGRGRWFRLDVRGWDNSGGTLVLDGWGLLYSWYRHFGTRRPLHVLAHELALSHNAVGRWFAHRGLLHASQPMAIETLREHRRDVLVMPGGDLDTWRPYRDRFRVRFAGRMGYARLALKTGVPIVPVANAGVHSTLLVLSDGARIAKALNLQKIARASIWPIHLALPWGLTFGPLPHLPLPKKLKYRFGQPIEPKRLHGREPEEREVRALDLKVRSEVQHLLDQLAAGG